MAMVKCPELDAIRVDAYREYLLHNVTTLIEYLIRVPFQVQKDRQDSDVEFRH